MPILWRTLLGQYLKVLVLCIFSFIAILLVSRLQEMAHLASFGASFTVLSLFILYQIPYILPIALPIASLLSSFLLFQNLSENHLLTTLRTQGISLRQITLPLLLASLFLSLANFYIASELATRSHLATRKMVHTLTSVNPLLLLQNAKIAQLKGAYIQMDPIKQGEEVKNLIVAIPSPQCPRLNLLLAKKLKIEKGELIAEGVTLIGSTPSAHNNNFDHLIVENQRSSASRAAECARLIRSKGWRIANDHLRFDLLQARLKTLTHERFFSRNKQKCYSEMMRRVFFGAAPLSFTLMGMAFGVGISRTRTKKRILTLLILSSLTLISFFVAKAFDHLFLISAVLYIIPHMVVILLSRHELKKIDCGFE